MDVYGNRIIYYHYKKALKKILTQENELFIESFIWKLLPLRTPSMKRRFLTKDKDPLRIFRSSYCVKEFTSMVEDKFPILNHNFISFPFCLQCMMIELRIKYGVCSMMHDSFLSKYKLYFLAREHKAGTWDSPNQDIWFIAAEALILEHLSWLTYFPSTTSSLLFFEVQISSKLKVKIVVILSNLSLLPICKIPLWPSIKHLTDTIIETLFIILSNKAKTDI